MPEEDGLSIIRDLKQRTQHPDHHADRDREPDRPRGRARARRRRLPRQAVRAARTAGAHPLGAAAKRPARSRPPAAPRRGRRRPAERKLVRFGTKWLDLEAQTLRDDDGNEHPLTASEFSLLKAFAANPKRVLSRERLLDLANARDAEAFDRAIDLRIMRNSAQDRARSGPSVDHPHHPRRRLRLLPGRRNALQFRCFVDPLGRNNQRISNQIVSCTPAHETIFFATKPFSACREKRRNPSCY